MYGVKERYREKFYRGYLLYTALETDLLLWVVFDVTFLMEVKKLSADEVSLITFLSLGFSILIQYPLLKVINRIGNKAAVRTGSILFLLSALCFALAPGFWVILSGGFLKCIAHTLNAMGPALLKNRLEKDDRADQYVAYQSDANSAVALTMMLTSLICGFLFEIYAYLPMIVCILFGLLGVFVSFAISRDESASNEITEADSLKKIIDGRKNAGIRSRVLMLVSFAVFTALTGTGLSYVKMNTQSVLMDKDPGYIVMLLGVVSTLVYFLRILSNTVMKKKYARYKEYSMAIAAILLIAGLLMQAAIWPFITGHTEVILSVGYLLIAFVRDPYVTFAQSVSLKSADPQRQQSMLIALNGAKKAGALALSAAGTLVLKNSGISSVMMIMTVAASANLVLVYAFIRNFGADRR